MAADDELDFPASVAEDDELDEFRAPMADLLKRSANVCRVDVTSIRTQPVANG